MSYQSMKDAFLRMWTAKRREQVRAKEASFDPVEFERIFWSLPNDAAKYVYFRTGAVSFAKSDALLNRTTEHFGAWVNAMDYNAMLGGYTVHYLRWTPQGIVGPNGLLPPDAKMEWATVGGVPAFDGELRRK